MSILGWILFGFIVGLIARAIMPAWGSLSFVGTTLLGILGALLAGWFGHAMGWYSSDTGAGFVSATLGAVFVLGIYYMVTGRRRRGVGSATSDANPKMPGVDTDHRDAA